MSTDDYELDEYGNKIQDLTNNYEDQRKDIENVKSHLVRDLIEFNDHFSKSGVPE